MKPVTALLAWLIAVCLGLMGCADGGVGGTGVSASATLEGNVQDISAEGSAASGMSGIRVSVRDSDVSDVTDDEGFFYLAGPIAGDRVVEFTQGGTDQPATMNVTVLGGGETELKDIHIFADTLRAVAGEIRVKIADLVLDDAAECTDGRGSFHAHPTVQSDFLITVVIAPDTEIFRLSDGSPLGCDGLTAGSVVNVKGTLANPREIEANTVSRQKSGVR